MKKQTKTKYKVAHNGKEALELLNKAKKGESILWDERTPCKVIHEWFTKTNNSQQDNRSVKSGLLQPADIHNREQEYDLIEKALMFKPILNPNQMAMFHRYIKQAKLKGIKLGKRIRKDEIEKIIDEMIDRNQGGLDDIETWKNVLSKSAYETESRIGYNIICNLKRLKQMIKGDEK